MTISKKKKKTSQDYEKSLNGLKCPSFGTLEEAKR